MKQLIIAVMLITLTAQAQNDAATNAILQRVKDFERKELEAKKQKADQDSIFNYSNTNYDYLTSLKKIPDEATARKIADELAATLPNKVRVVETKDVNGYFILVFGAADMTDEQYKLLDQDTKDSMFRIRFSYWNDGENKDLEIKGVKRFYLAKIDGKYLQLFPIWKTYIMHNAELEKCQRDFNQFKDLSKKLAFNFYKEGNWTIYNKSGN